MYLEIEKHLPGFNDTVNVYDEDGNSVFEIDSRTILMKRTIRVFDNEERVVAVVEKHDVLIEPTFSIFINGDLVGELIKEFTFFEPRFHILSDFGPIFTQGDIVNLNFKLLDSEGNLLAVVLDELSDDDDCYGIEMDDEVDPIFIVALLFAIDVQIND